MLGMATDITEHRQAEERLREYEKAVEGSEEIMAVIDREYRYLIANRKFLKLRNMTKEQVVGRLVPEILNKRVFESVIKDKLDECFAGKVVKYEMKYAYPEIGERDLLVSYFPSKVPLALIGLLVFCRTSLKANELLRHYERVKNVFVWRLRPQRCMRTSGTLQPTRWCDPRNT
jgi:PAS domain S-box-containing protein